MKAVAKAAYVNIEGALLFPFEIFLVPHALALPTL